MPCGPPGGVKRDETAQGITQVGDLLQPNNRKMVIGKELAECI